MKLTNNIKKYRKAHKLTQEELASKLGVKFTAVSAWETGRSFPLMDKVTMMAQIFEVEISDLFLKEDISSMSNVIKVKSTSTLLPMYGKISAGIPLDMITADDMIEAPEIIGKKFPNAFFLTINGDSMDKIIQDGSFALIDPCEDIHDGDIYAVSINNSIATLKRIHTFPNGIVLKPESNNPNHEMKVYDCSKGECDDVKVIGKMVWGMLPFDIKF